MEQRASYGNRKRPPSAAARSSSSPPAIGPEDFPGCEAFHLPAAELEGYEGRLEFWDGRTRTAWRVCEPTTIDIERDPLPDVVLEVDYTTDASSMLIR